MKGLAGKVVLVTGGAGGLGRAIVERFLDEGAKVVATDVRAGEIEPGGALVELIHDVTCPESWAAAMQAAVDAFGPVDIVVNNAGISHLPGLPQDPESVTLDHWRAVQTVNVEGVLLGCQAAIRAMKERGGVIANISSISALQPSPKMAAYGASKAAVHHLTRTVAAYCTQQGYPIRCNSIHPGWIPTAMTRGSRTPEELAAQERAIPMGRFGEAGDVASAVVFLCSDESAYITGSKVVMDGGISMQ